MTNEEKAIEIARGCFSKRTVDLPVNKLEQIIIKDACLKAMEWKEEQIVEWLKCRINDYLVKGRDIDLMFDDLKQAMKEE